MPPLADLVAGTVTIPANAVVGQDITISYQVTNQSNSPADGTWFDSLYLAPTDTWSASDPLLGRVPEYQDLPAGGSYTGTLTAPLPGITPGSYYVILRTNILDTLPESTLSNNLSASLTATAISAPALTLGAPSSGTLTDAQSAFYQVTVAAGQTLNVSLTSQQSTALNEVYVSYGTMPTRGQFDYRFSDPGADQEITVPATQAGTYYILVYAAAVSSENYSIEAALVPFSITAVSPSRVGAGQATIEIDGSKFDNGTTFQLLGPNSIVVQDSAVFLQNQSSAVRNVRSYRGDPGQLWRAGDSGRRCDDHAVGGACCCCRGACQCPILRLGAQFHPARPTGRSDRQLRQPR